MAISSSASPCPSSPQHSPFPFSTIQYIWPLLLLSPRGKWIPVRPQWQVVKSGHEEECEGEGEGEDEDEDEEQILGQRQPVIRITLDDLSSFEPFTHNIGDLSMTFHFLPFRSFRARHCIALTRSPALSLSIGGTHSRLIGYSCDPIGGHRVAGALIRLGRTRAARLASRWDIGPEAKQVAGCRMCWLLRSATVAGARGRRIITNKCELPSAPFGGQVIRILFIWPPLGPLVALCAGARVVQ